MRARVKNWTKFQHYKNRTPPWIKLHRDILDDFKFHALPLASRALAPCIWLLASESDDGTVDVSPEFLSWRLRITPSEADRAVTGLINNGFLIPASTMLAPCLHDACLETEGETEEETEEEKEYWSFADFWSAYPKKVGKGACETKWRHLTDEDRAGIEGDMGQRIWPDPEFIPNPLTYLNQKRWLDEDKAPPKKKPADDIWKGVHI